MLWRCWLGGRKGIQSVKTEWWGAGVVVCLERGADLHMAQLMPLPLTVSCFSKIQIGLPFWYRLTRVVPEKGPLNTCMCVFSHIKVMMTMLLRGRCHRHVGQQHGTQQQMGVVSHFYRAMLCIRGTSHGPVSVSVCLSQVGVLLKRLNVGSHKQHHTIAQGL